MTSLFLKEFHRATKFFKEGVKRLTLDQSLSPKEWKATKFKTYEGATEILLPEFPKIETSYRKIIEERSSHRSLDEYSTLSLSDISAVLHLSARQLDSKALDGRGRRPVASAGPLFPLEVYILISRTLININPGIYHYRPDVHTLETILSEERVAEIDLTKLFVDPIADTYPVAVFITGIFDRTTLKYGNRAYRYLILEAGAMGQAMQNAATLIGQRSLIFGGTFDDSVEKILGIDGVAESLVNTVLVK